LTPNEPGPKLTGQRVRRSADPRWRIELRLEYKFELSEVETPRFAVEAVEGIGKIFSLASLVLNVLETKRSVEIVFHGLNPEDPDRKIEAFQKIINSSSAQPNVAFENGTGGRVPGSSSYFQWLTVQQS
jgi:hypothetical protein